MKTAIVNFANGAWYPRGQTRLRKSLVETGFTGDFFGYQQYSEIDCPPHSSVPYAFKTYCLGRMRGLGYDAAIYVDASVWAVKSWEPIWDMIEKQGYYIEAAGAWTGNWTKDSVLEKFGVTRDQAMTIPMFSAGFTGLNFHNDLANEFLTQWHSYCVDHESFKGTWGNENGQMSKDPRCKGHRHDMSVASLLAWKLGMTIGEGGHFLAYIGKGYGKPHDTVVAYLQPC
jgi:hypothetical protein